MEQQGVWIFRRRTGHVYWRTDGDREQAIAELLDYLGLELVRVQGQSCGLCNRSETLCACKKSKKS